jgi:hypothetical protein
LTRACRLTCARSEGLEPPTFRSLACVEAGHDGVVRLLLAEPNKACASEGQHFERYLRACRRGLISREAMRAVCAVLGPVSAGKLLLDTRAERRPASREAPPGRLTAVLWAPARTIFLPPSLLACAVVCPAERGRWRPQADDTGVPVPGVVPRWPVPACSWGSLGGPGGGLRMGGAEGNHPGEPWATGKGSPGWFPPAALLA